MAKSSKRKSKSKSDSGVQLAQTIRDLVEELSVEVPWPKERIFRRATMLLMNGMDVQLAEAVIAAEAEKEAA